jgi:hypothetical protein
MGRAARAPGIRNQGCGVRHRGSVGARGSDGGWRADYRPARRHRDDRRAALRANPARLDRGGPWGYALWRLFQALKDPDREGSDAKGIAKRAGHALGALVYAGLALSAGQLVVASSGGGGSSPQDWTAWLLSQPFGQVLVIGVGAGVVGYGLSQLYQAYQAEFREYLKLGEMTIKEETWITRAGRLGYAAPGLVFGIVGIFLIQAALRFEPSEATGLDGALKELLHQPFGPWLLGLVALGLIAYGLFMIAMARYRRIAW